MEQWKQFKETEMRKYYVSTEGRVKHLDKTTGAEFMMNPNPSSSGRRQIHIAETNKKYYVYRLVAQAFIPNPENKPTVNHIRGLDGGDAVDNLEWMTQAEQEIHAREIGLKTSGYIPVVVLDTNAIIIAQHDTKVEAFARYDGKQMYYNKDVQIIGNVVAMKQSYYNDLSDDERFNICSDCLERMLKFAYIIDGQLIDKSTNASERVNSSQPTVVKATKNKLIVNINGYEISRVKNLIGVGING